MSGFDEGLESIEVGSLTIGLGVLGLVADGAAAIAETATAGMLKIANRLQNIVGVDND
ncbi:hypothetical protein FDI69_gp120 [Rhodococcus phage Trina]|uniref:Uncharacterized protein n=1 Tax=Rhodococcus phage Trina TaxID=2027905 RepID=A0A2D1ADN3_9CAUD|nr:hypothetical protein FDI69_gp120 [Rhodococcus phage Trina]ASZ74934.1 hypothetical protein SEA_TRINA_120 [Rhodococcus phage Trina]